MGLSIKREALEQIVEHCRRDYPKEACGLLIGRGDEIFEAFPTDNLRADEREDRYLINPDQHLVADEKARVENLEIIGCYHSHPDWPAKPSPNDLENSWPSYIYIIVNVLEGEPKDTSAWKLDHTEKAFEEITLKIKGHNHALKRD